MEDSSKINDNALVAAAVAAAIPQPNDHDGGNVVYGDGNDQMLPYAAAAVNNTQLGTPPSSEVTLKPDDDNHHQLDIGAKTPHPSQFDDIRQNARRLLLQQPDATGREEQRLLLQQPDATGRVEQRLLLQQPDATGRIEQQQQITEDDIQEAAKLSPSLELTDHRLRIYDAMKLTNNNERDAALISALRGVNEELEVAKEEEHRANKRVENVKELFDLATHALCGGKVNAVTSWKRGRKRKGEEVEEVEEKLMEADASILGPLRRASGGGLTEEEVTLHRNAFYEKLCGVPYAELGSFQPNQSSVNLKSKAQLEQYIYIAEHWDSGTPEMNVTDFRRLHKSFYTKMKVSKENIGRRTGHHLRDVAGSEGRKAFCRYAKSNQSLMYISVEELYDAIFELHSLNEHVGWHTVKKDSNLKYANIPQEQIRIFVETCPICSLRKEERKGQKSRAIELL